MSGRLTLSWANKDQALVPDGHGSYTWVPRDHPRLTEVRLLEQNHRIGETSGSPTDNLLIQGDNYDALHALLRTPEYAQYYRGKVKLVYIDPPFNTGQAFEHYDDALEHSVWLGMMRERLLLIRELLDTDGSVWVHLDDAEMAYCRALMDEIFGRSNFIATIVWQKVYSPKNSAKHLSVDQDYILVYARDSDTWRPNDLTRTSDMDSAYRNPDNDERGPWKPGDLVANKPYNAGRYGFTTPSGRYIEGPPPGRYWRVSKDKLNSLDDDNRIWWGADGDNIPAVKRFLSEVRGRVPQTLWSYAEVGHNQTGKNELQALFPGAEPFTTPKPESLLQRVITIGSDRGDIVLDCFAGSGTTAAVAHKLHRKWVAIEESENILTSFAEPRLSKVVKGQDPGGVTEETVLEPENQLPEGVRTGQPRQAANVLKKLLDNQFVESSGVDEQSLRSLMKSLRDVDRSKTRVTRRWPGGGGFRVETVGPSLYEHTDDYVLLADWAKGEEFTQAIAAQLGFFYETDTDGPLSGRKGRVRLAVVDGVADDTVVKSIVSRLEDNERVTIVAKSATPEASQTLRTLSKGSRLLKAPKDLVRRGRVVR